MSLHVGLRVGEWRVRLLQYSPLHGKGDSLLEVNDAGEYGVTRYQTHLSQREKPLPKWNECCRSPHSAQLAVTTNGFCVRMQ